MPSDQRKRRVAPADERFWALVDKGDGCWEWTGCTTKKGYGQFKVRRGVTALAHRFSWESANGPTRLLVCHTCDNPRCVRPDHLFIGTNDDNVADRVAKNRSARNGGTKNGRAKLTPQQVEEIRMTVPGACGLARKYGVDRTTIRKVRLGVLWK